MAYVCRRLLLVLPTLLGLSLLAFFLITLAPGDPAEELIRRINGRPPLPGEVEAVRQELGLDGPLPYQFVHWLGNVVTGDLGTSYSSRRPVASEIADRVPNTLQLAIPSAVIALAIALPLGTFSAVRRNRPADQVLRAVSLAGASIPSFWLALLLVLLFAVHLSLVPTAGRGGLETFVLPVLTLSLEPAAVLARFTRSAMLETLGEDYVRTARAKGLSELVVVGRHALRNALIPVVTYFGSRLGHLLTGAVLVETIFVWPGLGRLTFDAVTERDYPMIQGIVLFAGVTFALINLVVDLSYALIDARVRLGGHAVRTA